MVRLAIFSDPSCPWCYIGKARLGRALEKRPDHPFAVQWHPFILNPDMPVEGMSRRVYLETKFGGVRRAASVNASVKEAAESSGLAIDLDAITRSPNTFNAHRLIHWAGIEGRQTAAVSALFTAYFVEGRDIGETRVLCEVAEQVGMDGEAVARLIASDADVEHVRARDAEARRIGVRAVPTFVIAQRHVVPGAQPVKLWLDVIDEINGTGLPEAVSTADGDAC